MNILKKATIALVAGMALTPGLGKLVTHHVQADSEQVINKEIDNYIKKTSLKQKIGQMYVARTPQQPGKAEEDAYKYNLGGYIIYDADLKNYSQHQFKSKLDNYQTVAHIPLLVGIDQEGGQVSRLTHTGFVSQNGDQFKFPREQYENAEKSKKGTGMSAVTKYAQDTATLLRDLGINWNYAPDADYSDDASSFIYQRGFGGVAGKNSYKKTAEYIAQVVPAWQHDNLVAATLKHFPGYGDANDTHTGFAHNTKTKSQILNKDILPFKAGINAGADSVMVTHVIYDHLDRKYPASLSKKINTLLRKECNFDGVVVTDALEMGAIKDFAAQHGHANADVLAVKAGNDMIMSSDYAQGIPEIEKAVKKGQISQKQINASVKRILQMKNKLHLLTPSSLQVRKNSKYTFTLNDITYNKNSMSAQISGKARKGTQIIIKNSESKKVVKKVKANKLGKFNVKIPLKSSSQNLLITGKNYISVSVLISSKKQAFPSTKTFTVNKVSYNKKHTQATISGKVPDAGAQGSLQINFINKNTRKSVGSTVVGKSGKFSFNLKLEKKKQVIEIVPEDKDYISHSLTVKAK